ncbi:MAG: YncE family protein [Candidatus Kryptoniota bacterium]
MVYSGFNYGGHSFKSIKLVVQNRADSINNHKESVPEFKSLKLKFVEDIPLPGGVKRFDYQTIDEVHRKLYISHMGANLVTVFDLTSNKVVANLKDIPRPTGILAVPELNRVYVSSSAENKVYVFDVRSLKLVCKVATGTFPDGIAYSPKLKRIFVSCEFGGVVTVFNALDNDVMTNISIGGHVGNTHLDPASNMIYSTDQTHGKLIEIDPGTLKIVASYYLKSCRGPHGFYIDGHSHYAFITGEDNATYVVFDLSSKKIVSRGKVGSEPDVLSFDISARRLYVASESGVVSVFEIEKGAVNKLGQSFFEKNAHTVCVDQITHYVFFPLQNVNGRPVLRIMKPELSSE